MKKLALPIILITLFIIIVSAIAILTAKGISFTGNKVISNGILEVKSNPSESKVIIDGKEKGSTPERIELSEGTHEIVLQSRGYTDWKKEIQIEGSIVNSLDVQLYPSELNVEQTTFTDIDKVNFTDDKSQAVYTVRKGQNQGIWINKIERNVFELSKASQVKISELESIKEKCEDLKIYSIKLSHDNQRSIFKCKGSIYFHFFIFKNTDIETEPIYINKAIGFNPNKVEFNFDSNNILIEDDAILINFNLTTKETSLILRKVTKDALAVENFGDKKLIMHNTFDGKKQISILNTTLELEKVVLNNLQDEYELKMQEITNFYGDKSNSNYFIVGTDEKSFVVRLKDKKFTPLTKKINKLLSWSNDGNVILFENDNQLFSLRIKNYPDGTYKNIVKRIEDNLNTKNSIVKFASSSDQVLIYNSKKKKLYSKDLDGSNTKLLFEGELSQNSSFTISQNGTFLVLLLKDQKESSNLYSMKLKI